MKPWKRIRNAIFTLMLGALIFGIGCIIAKSEHEPVGKRFYYCNSQCQMCDKAICTTNETKQWEQLLRNASNANPAMYGALRDKTPDQVR